MIESLSKTLNLPPDEVYNKYVSLIESGELRGRTHISLLGTAMYIIARQRGLPVTIADIAKTLDMDEKELRTSIKSIVKSINVSITPPTAESFIKSLAQKFSLPDHVVNHAIMLASKFSFSGKREAIAAAALYISANEHGFRMTERELAKAVNVSELTLRKIKHEFFQSLLGCIN